jgi:hypothetical protein
VDACKLNSERDGRGARKHLTCHGYSSPTPVAAKEGQRRRASRRCYSEVSSRDGGHGKEVKKKVVGNQTTQRKRKHTKKSTLRGGCGDEKRKICSLVFCFLPCSSRSVSLSLSRCPYIHTRTYTGTPTHACVYVRTAALRCWLVVRFSLFFFFFLTTLAKKAALSAVRRELEELRGGVTIIIIICFLFAVFVCFLLFKT